MNKQQLDSTLDYISKALTVIALIAGGGAIAKFRMQLFETYPDIGLVLGFFVVIAGFYLYWSLVMHASKEIEAAYHSKRAGIFYGGFLVVVAFLFLMAALLATSNPTQQGTPADPKTAARSSVG